MAKLRTRLRVLMAEKTFRDKRKITQKVVAIETGLPQSTISKLINDDIERIETETLKRLCQYFECQVGDILFIDNESE